MKAGTSQVPHHGTLLYWTECNVKYANHRIWYFAELFFGLARPTIPPSFDIAQKGKKLMIEQMRPPRETS